MVSSSPTRFFKVHFFNGTKARNKFFHHRANNQNAFVSNLAILHIQWHRKMRRRASRLFTILQCNISSQYETKWTLMAIAQPTRDCAANRSSSTDFKALSRNKRTQKHLLCEKILQVARKFVYNSSELDRCRAWMSEWVSRLSSVNMFCFDTSIHTDINWCSNEANVNICLSD